MMSGTLVANQAKASLADNINSLSNPTKLYAMLKNTAVFVILNN
jgi:hypothetical protein